MIAFVRKPSLALFTIADMQLIWLHEVDNREHEVFKQLSKINGLRIERKGKVLVFFHFNLVQENIIMASSLTFPEYEFLRKSIR